MPLDPFFTSSVSLPAKQRDKISKKRLLNPDEQFRENRKEEKRAGIPYFVSGKPSLTGFRPPKKVWDDKRITRTA